MKIINTHFCWQVAIRHCLCRTNEFHSRSHMQFFLFTLLNIKHICPFLKSYFMHLLCTRKRQFAFPSSYFWLFIFFFAPSSIHFFSYPLSSPPPPPPPAVCSVLVDWCRPPRCSSRRKRKTWFAPRCLSLAPHPPLLPREIRWENVYFLITILLRTKLWTWVISVFFLGLHLLID